MDVYIPAGLVPAAYGLLFETWMNSMEPILRRANLSPTELKEKDPLLGIGILASNDEWSMATDNTGNIITVEYGGASAAWRERLDHWLACYDQKLRDDAEKEQGCFEEGVVFGHRRPEMLESIELVTAAGHAARRYCRDTVEWDRHAEAMRAMFCFGYGVGSQEEHQEKADPTEEPAPTPAFTPGTYTTTTTPLVAGMGDAELRRLGQQFGAAMRNRYPQVDVKDEAADEFDAMNVNGLWTEAARQVFIDGATNPPPPQRTFTRYEPDLETAIIAAALEDAAEQGSAPGWQDLAEEAKAHINRLAPMQAAVLSLTDFNALLVAYGAGYADKVAKDEGFPPYEEAHPLAKTIQAQQLERANPDKGTTETRLSFYLNHTLYDLTTYIDAPGATLLRTGQDDDGNGYATASDALYELLNEQGIA